MNERVYGRWRDEYGVVHDVSGVWAVSHADPMAMPAPGRWDTNSRCGLWLDSEPRQLTQLTTCLKCISRSVARGILRSASLGTS